MRFIAKYAGGLFWLLVTLIILFVALSFIANHAPKPVSTVARGAEHLAQPH